MPSDSHSPNFDFDPGAASSPESGVFGLPHGPDSADVWILGVPFEATTSYRPGTASGPSAILQASRQIDLFDLWFGRPYERGIWMAPIDPDIESWSRTARALAAPLIEKGGAEAADEQATHEIAALGVKVNDLVKERTAGALSRGKLPVMVGGDHSTPFGAIAACAASTPGLGILQFDAHADLRPAFEGFEWSHASILHNVLKRVEGVGPLVQVGIRDLCEQEFDAIQSDDRIHAVTDRDLTEARCAGTVRALAEEAIARLPDNVYVTFDVDALDPTLCPNTGTPVPNGLLWDETMIWLEALGASGKRVVGLDLNEVSPGPDAKSGENDTWDAIVGARLLYRLIGAALVGR